DVGTREREEVSGPALGARLVEMRAVERAQTPDLRREHLYAKRHSQSLGLLARRRRPWRHSEEHAPALHRQAPNELLGNLHALHHTLSVLHGTIGDAARHGRVMSLERPRSRRARTEKAEVIAAEHRQRRAH